jgi:hypothetical protein
MKRICFSLLVFTIACTTSRPVDKSSSRPADSSTTAPVASKPQRLDGFIPLRWDEANGKLMMEISHFNEELIFQTSLAAGVGSNPIGLDRNQLGQTHVVRFERVGPRVLMIEPNYAYRAHSTDPAERRSVEESFAQSVLAGFKVESETAGGVVVDATDFFLSDQHGVARRIREAEQGSYTVDKSRSAIYMPRTKAFPLNTEVESTLTFAASDRPGQLVRGVTPTAESLTVREHFSFVASPPPGFTPRIADPRVGSITIDFYDYASEFIGPISQHLVIRHRLQKKDPTAAVSEPVKPIVYYVDNGAPEPIRSALIEGASWWNQAFEAAGFRNAFQVKVLPPDADPLDIRYNVINWVHRSTRGWSYGAAVVDPRTGEIIKGNVSLGSLRIRQDAMIGAGLVGQVDEAADANALAGLDPKTSPALMALARIRQLAAHETGHTLGLDHNMAASTIGRASVMDYPSPHVKITDGKIDLSDAYARGMGAYDLAAIRYVYSELPPGENENAALDKLARAVPLFVSDPHSRPVSGAHPLGSVWDDGTDPVASLRHEIEVRRIALSQFGLNTLTVGQPLSALEETLVPLYLHHRYQTEAAAKSIGGLYFSYSVKEKDGVSPEPVRSVVPAKQQRDALSAVLSTLDVDFLAIPQRILDLIPPPAFAHGDANTELFPRHTDPAFDPVAAAMTAADVTISALLDPSRDARLVQFHEENRDNPSLHEVLDALNDVAMRQSAVTRATRTVLVSRLVGLAQNNDAAPQVVAEATDALRRLSARLKATTSDETENVHRRATRDDIERFLARPAEVWKPLLVPAVPPGPPI